MPKVDKMRVFRDPSSVQLDHKIEGGRECCSFSSSRDDAKFFVFNANVDVIHESSNFANRQPVIVWLIVFRS